VAVMFQEAGGGGRVYSEATATGAVTEFKPSSFSTLARESAFIMQLVMVKTEVADFLGNFQFPGKGNKSEQVITFKGTLTKRYSIRKKSLFGPGLVIKKPQPLEPLQNSNQVLFQLLHVMSGKHMSFEKKNRMGLKKAINSLVFSLEAKTRHADVQYHQDPFFC
jgi:hypothetical protein